MKNPINSEDQERVLGVLHSRGWVSSEDLMAVLGKSQPTVSRVLASLSGRVLAFGNARARRYGLPRLIRGRPARQPVWWTDEQGRTHELAMLTFLAAGMVCIESESIQSAAYRELPWFLTALRAQGFLGRIHARRFQYAGLHEDPEQWDLEGVLFAALHLHDAPGAITLGDAGQHQEPSHRLADGARLPGGLDRLARDIASTLPAGSSAGGEQPKFLATLDRDRHVLVKFTPPRATPFGDRWHDLLWAEWLAGRVLQAHGFEVAQAQVVSSATRTYLVSERFDRIGAAGRRHVLSIGDVHKAFVADAYSHWAATAGELRRQGRLRPPDAQRASALLGFGRLIGNTDMHSGNLGLFVDRQDLAKGRFRLAPVYDMLPMRWRPNPEMGGAADYGPFEPELSPITRPALPVARDYWERMGGLAEVSAGMRRLAVEMVRRLARA